MLLTNVLRKNIDEKFNSLVQLKSIKRSFADVNLLKKQKNERVRWVPNFKSGMAL